MRRIFLRMLSGLTLLGLLSIPLMASAHQTITDQGYDIEYGWVNEPVIINQPNAVVINITPHIAAGAGAVSLVAPADKASVQGDHVDVTVAFSGLPDTAAANGVHWHLMVDDQLIAMEALSQTTVTLSGLANGDHTVEAMLAGASHATIGSPSMAKITVAGAAAAGQVAANTSMGSMDMGQPSMAMPDVDVSGLVISASYGGQNKTLALQPLGEDTPGQFVAPMMPTVAGKYTIQLSGKIDGQAIDTIQVEPEEANTPDLVQFPKAADPNAALTAQLAAAQSQASTAQTLAIVGVVLGLIGTAVCVYALMRKH
jgi:hypothetical protein